MKGQQSETKTVSEPAEPGTLWEPTQGPLWVLQRVSGKVSPGTMDVSLQANEVLGLDTPHIPGTGLKELPVYFPK